MKGELETNFGGRPIKLDFSLTARPVIQTKPVIPIVAVCDSNLYNTESTVDRL